MFKNSNFSEGFSLIELLISITIIGIIASVILNSLSKSRERAYDTQIKSQLSQFRTAASMYYANNGNYSDANNCSQGIFNDFDPNNGKPGILIAAGNLPDFTEIRCRANSVDYAVKATLYSGNEYYCVDNRGASRVISEEIGGPVTSCP
ncbi:MAG: prepilin-type N-terminal cleavage/methylation domain-containing protein [Candidatus Zambryskibacteria bacterium]|nr:prepilin-type N-terminal cleavage/methylation domain-containing protein [Candidatus Zambryskibacteria bacterium]